MKQIKHFAAVLLAMFSMTGCFSKNHCEAQAQDHIAATNVASGFDALYTGYFALKDAFVKSDANAITQRANELLTQIETVDAAKRNASEAEAWNESVRQLKKETAAIAAAGNIKKQREGFARLSSVLYALIKKAGSPTGIYYQKCPMFNDGKGATWLSRDKAIKNPYYGSAMLTCGTTAETL